MSYRELVVRSVRALMRAPDDPPPQQRPKNLLYTTNERPPLAATVVLAVQHAALALALLVYALIVADEVGITGPTLTSFLSITILMLGIGTILQSAVSRLGPGLLLVHIPSPIMIGIYILVAKAGGIAVAGGTLILTGFLQILGARLLPRLRTVFPPEVIGVLVLMLGLSLIPPGSSRILGVGLETDGTGVDAVSAAIGLLTLTTIIAVSVWAKGQLRMLSLIIGAAVGGSAAWFVGMIDTGMLVADTPFIAIPSPSLPRLIWAPELVILVLLAVILGSLDTIGAVLTVDRMNDAGWRRANLGRVSRGIQTEGVAHVLAGACGGFASAVSSANIGLAKATGVTSRSVGTATGIILVVLAFFPQVSIMISLIPAPVMGAVTVYAAAFLITSGMELILSRMLDNRRIFMVGISVVGGISVMVLPELRGLGGPQVGAILGSPLALTAVLVVGLHLLFRIGRSQTASLEVHPKTSPKDVADFLEGQGMEWGARREVVGSAAQAASEAVEFIRQSPGADADIRINGTFDEYNLNVTIIHDGPALVAGGPAPDLHQLLEGDDDAAADAAIDNAMSAVSGLLIRRLADQVRTSEKNGRQHLLLHFEH